MRGLTSGCGTKHILKWQFGIFLNSEDHLDVFWKHCLLLEVTLQEFQNAFMTQWGKFPERISTHNCDFPWNICQMFNYLVSTGFGVDNFSVHNDNVSSKNQNSLYTEKYRNWLLLLLIRFCTDIDDKFDSQVWI